MKLRCDHRNCKSQFKQMESLYASSACSYVLLLPLGHGLTLPFFGTFNTVVVKISIIIFTNKLEKRLLCKKTQTIQRTNQVIQVADAKCGKMHADESQLDLVLFLIG